MKEDHIEPWDFHPWEQGLGLCLQPLPAVFCVSYLYVYSSADQALICYPATSHVCTFKGFSFWSRLCRIRTCLPPHTRGGVLPLH